MLKSNDLHPTPKQKENEKKRILQNLIPLQAKNFFFLVFTFFMQYRVYIILYLLLQNISKKKRNSLSSSTSLFYLYGYIPLKMYTYNVLDMCIRLYTKEEKNTTHDEKKENKMQTLHVYKCARFE